jgi:hypothetical protein
MPATQSRATCYSGSIFREASMLIMLTAVLLTANSVSAFAQAGPVDRWGGFKVGSWIKAKNTYESGDLKAEQEVKQTLAEAKPEECAVTNELSGGGMATIRFRRDLLSTIAAPECTVVERKDLADEEIKIASRTLKCQVRVIRWKLSKDAKIVDSLKLWESDQVPGRVAKIEGTLHDFGAPEEAGWTYAGQITSLDTKLTIASKEIACALLELSATGPGQWTNKVWVTDSIPSKIARSIGIREAQGKKETGEWQIVDFEVKK